MAEGSATSPRLPASGSEFDVALGRQCVEHEELRVYDLVGQQPLQGIPTNANAYISSNNTIPATFTADCHYESIDTGTWTGDLETEAAAGSLQPMPLQLTPDETAQMLCDAGEPSVSHNVEPHWQPCGNYGSGETGRVQ